MFAVVDFDRKETHFFNSFQEASNFIAQYPVVIVDMSGEGHPVIETVVVVDMSGEGPVCELL